jgi:hypothetical protein
VVERVVLPPEAEADLPDDEGAALAVLADHPLRQDVRLAVAAMRDGTPRSGDALPAARRPGSGPRRARPRSGLADALAATLED